MWQKELHVLSLARLNGATRLLFSDLLILQDDVDDRLEKFDSQQARIPRNRRSSVLRLHMFSTIFERHEEIDTFGENDQLSLLRTRHK